MTQVHTASRASFFQLCGFGLVEFRPECRWKRDSKQRLNWEFSIPKNWRFADLQMPDTAETVPNDALASFKCASLCYISYQEARSGA